MPDDPRRVYPATPRTDSPAGWLAPHAFLRGTAWFDRGRAVRADPGDLARLPWDIAERAALPIGVRVEFEAAPGTRAVELRYRATVPGSGDALRSLRHCFALWRDGRRVGELFTEPSEESTVSLRLPPGGGAFTVHLPESQAPVVLGLRAVGGAIAPAPSRPRWLVHGDSITEGWWSTRPAHAWPAVAGRILDLDTVNLGFAGGARGELPLAEQLASLPGELLTLAFGTNCWGVVPCSASLLYETTRSFVTLVRRGHPDTPSSSSPPSCAPRPRPHKTPWGRHSRTCAPRWRRRSGTSSRRATRVSCCCPVSPARAGRPRRRPASARRRP